MPSTPPPERLVLFEPRLCDLRGHYATMAVALAEAGRTRHMDVSIWCDARASDDLLELLRTAGARVRPVLRGRSFEALRARAVVWPAVALSALPGLRAAARDAGATGTLYLPSGGGGLASAPARAARGPGPRGAVQVGYWDRRDADARHAPVARAIARLARRLVSSAPPRLKLFAHSEPLAAELSRELGREVAPIPLAVDWAPHADPSLQRAPGPPRVGVLGELRDEKGLDQLVAAIPLLGDRVEWLAQAAPSPNANEGLRRTLVERVRAAGGTVYETALAPGAYGDLLARCDVAALPYDPARYGRRTSGVVVEALGCAVLPVVPGGTWLAREVGTAGEVYAPYTPEALAAAIERAGVRALAEREYRARAALAVRQLNSAAGVLDAVVGEP